MRSNRKWCKRRGSSLECQNCFFVYPIIDSNLKNFLAAFLNNKVNFLLIKLSNIDIVSPAKQFNTNDVLIYSAVIHISSAKDSITNTGITQIKFLGAFKLFPAMNVITLNIIKDESIAQILDISANCDMVRCCFICSQGCKTNVSGKSYFCTRLQSSGFKIWIFFIFWNRSGRLSPNRNQKQQTSLWVNSRWLRNAAFAIRSASCWYTTFAVYQQEEKVDIVSKLPYRLSLCMLHCSMPQHIFNKNTIPSRRIIYQHMRYRPPPAFHPVWSAIRSRVIIIRDNI